MMISDARLAANRRNAARSTGPKTVEGKAASRRNALKHGLTGTAVDLDDASVVAERAAPLIDEVKPRWSWQTWVAGEVAGITHRLDRLRREEAKLRDLVAYRALTTWDDDQRLAAANLGSRLASDPARVVLQLRATPQGCDWLIDRWVALAHLADFAESGAGKGWTSAQRRLAFDLLGKPPEARAEVLGMVLDEAGQILGPIRSDSAVARAALAELRDRRAAVAETDLVAQAVAEAGLDDETSLGLRRLRRYEAALHKRLVWCVEQLDRTDPRLPAALPPRLPFTPPSVAPAPPEPEVVAVVPVPEASSTPPPPGRPRGDARLQQAQSRRDRKRRKLERRRH